jgi:transposase InsO family protein
VECVRELTAARAPTWWSTSRLSRCSRSRTQSRSRGPARRSSSPASKVPVRQCHLPRLRASSWVSAAAVSAVSELRGRALDQWAYEHGVRLQFIEPGKPIQNAHIESFNARLREECLNEHVFVSLDDARSKIETRLAISSVSLARLEASSLNQRCPRAIALRRVESMAEVEADSPSITIRSSTPRFLSCNGTKRVIIRGTPLWPSSLSATMRRRRSRRHRSARQASATAAKARCRRQSI